MRVNPISCKSLIYLLISSNDFAPIHTNFSDCRKKLPAIRNFLCLKQIPEKRGKVLILKIQDCDDFINNNLD